MSSLVAYRLKPRIEYLAQELLRVCEREGVHVEVVRTWRTIEEQDALFAQGRTASGPIITYAQGGYSFHNFGVAFDIEPAEFVSAEEELFVYSRAGALGKQLGLEWGGDWEDFVDSPHFQYTGGYTTHDFRTQKVDWGKFM